jgi:hypothetical protein
VDWSDIVRAALSLFLVVSGLGLGYMLLRLAGVFGSLATALTRITDEVVPILGKTQSTVDGVNQQLGHVDEIMVSAVGATKSAEKAAGGVSKAVTTPIRKLAGLGAGLQQGLATFRARAAADRADRAAADQAARQAAEAERSARAAWSPSVAGETATPSSPSATTTPRTVGDEPSSGPGSS